LVAPTPTPGAFDKIKGSALSGLATARDALVVVVQSVLEAAPTVFVFGGPLLFAGLWILRRRRRHATGSPFAF
jgi:hypothetical protein